MHFKFGQKMCIELVEMMRTALGGTYGLIYNSIGRRNQMRNRSLFTHVKHINYGQKLQYRTFAFEFLHVRILMCVCVCASEYEINDLYSFRIKFYVVVNATDD